jgi:hypothetical protein
VDRIEKLSRAVHVDRPPTKHRPAQDTAADVARRRKAETFDPIVYDGVMEETGTARKYESGYAEVILVGSFRHRESRRGELAGSIVRDRSDRRDVRRPRSGRGAYLRLVHAINDTSP